MITFLAWLLFIFFILTIFKAIQYIVVYSYEYDYNKHEYREYDESIELLFTDCNKYWRIYMTIIFFGVLITRKIVRYFRG